MFTMQSAPDSGERVLNGFLRASKSKAAEARIIGRSGLVEQYDLGGRVQGQVVHQDELYVVAGNKLWRMDATPTDLGTLPDGEARLASGATQIGIVIRGDYYVYDSSATSLTLVTPGVITYAVDVCQLDGFFIIMGTGNGRGDCMQVSDLDDAATFDALDYAFTEANEDVIVGCTVDHGEIWVFGTRTTEKFYNDGVGLPLARNTSTFLEHGCAERDTIAKADNRVFWIGEDLVVYVGSGAETSVISQRWIEDLLQESTIESAFVFKDRGALFYCIRLTGRPALCYDITTGLWHERSTEYGGTWIAVNREIWNGIDWIGTTTGALCTFDEDTYSDDGTAFTFEAVSGPIVEPNRVRISRLQVIFGGGGEDIGRTPQVMLQVSKNGSTWGRERWRNLPNIGEYFKPVTWRALGMSRYWQARVRITDPVKRDLEGVFYE